MSSGQRTRLDGLAPSKVLDAGGSSIFIGDAELAFRKAQTSASNLLENGAAAG
jgi:hypothetical protein